MAKLTVDQNKCIACGTCVIAYPLYFRIAGNGKVEAIKMEASDQQIKDMINVCPVKAIVIKKE